MSLQVVTLASRFARGDVGADDHWRDADRVIEHVLLAHQAVLTAGEPVIGVEKKMYVLSA